MGHIIRGAFALLSVLLIFNSLPVKAAETSDFFGTYTREGIESLYAGEFPEKICAESLTVEAETRSFCPNGIRVGIVSLCHINEEPKSRSTWKRGSGVLPLYYRFKSEQLSSL